MRIKAFSQTIVATAAILAAGMTYALTIPMYGTDGNKKLGTVEAKDSKQGLKLIVNLQELPAGSHGFHVHEMASCAEHGMDAGMHFDPKKTHKHLGPNKNGHLGDLPVLVVDKSGAVKTTLVAPRLTVAMLKDRALMIHAGGDNYSDTPKKDGGGGERIACGVIK